MKYLLLLGGLLLSFSCQPLSAQTTNETNDTTSTAEESEGIDEEGLENFWQLSLPGGEFMVRLSQIASISRSQYLLDGTLVITEVTIDTLGQSPCRIYQITPAAQSGSSSAAQQLAERTQSLTTSFGDRTGSNFAEMVQKNYPTTTHAKTIEFRIRRVATLDALYSSLTRALREGSGRTFTISR